jgi:hypothetical protein
MHVVYRVVSRPLTVLAAIGFLAATTAQTAQAARPSAAKLLPDNTVAMVSVVNAPDLAQRFMNTAMGKMSQDPQLKPLIGQFYGSLSEAVAEVKDRIGLTLPEILALFQGEVTFAVIPAKDAPPAFVFLIDTGNQLPSARKMLEKGEAAIEQRGAKKTEEKVGDTKVIIYDSARQEGRRVAYFEKDATIVVGTDVEVLKKLLAAWEGQKASTLSDNANYAAVMSRCVIGKDALPQVVWFVDPVSIMKTVGQRNTGVRLAVTMLPALGLDGLSGVGGTLAMDCDQYDSIMHIHMLLETPRSGVIKMIAMQPGDVKPERWIPGDVADYTTLHWNLDQTYKTLGVVYDSFRGEGALAREMQQPLLNATGLDFEKEILPALDGRITIAHRIERPVTLRSRATVMGLKLKDTELATKAIDKLVAKYPDRFTKKSYAGKTYYEVKIPVPENTPEEQRPPVPCFGILDDCAVMADRVSLYEKLVVTLAEGKSLADELDFQLVASKIERQNGENKPAMITFDRPEEGMRFLYDLATADSTRQALARGAENNRFFKSIDAAMKQNPLPPFGVLQKYLAPGGASIVDDETGIHYSAFSLRRKGE